ncbi:MAG: Clp protease N-terminal domain-containing protein, partial [Longimicrobiales bacterium]|nr:Clp protease N-terminal domain-containing protein [Longimicrobiales bacterium]
MNDTGQVEQAAKRAIARAKGRGAEEVTPDDLLMGALLEISRFGIAWIGERPIDVGRLSENGGFPEEAATAGSDTASGETASSAPAYDAGSVALLERAAGLARDDGAVNMGLGHLLAAFPDVECGLLARIFRDQGISEVQWRAEL